MSALRFGALVVGLLVASQLVLWTVVASDSRTKVAVLLGGLLATLNALAAYGCARWAAARSVRAFMLAILGGMTVRILALLGLTAAAIIAAHVPALALALSLLAYFMVFLVLELLIVPRLFRPVTP